MPCQRVAGLCVQYVVERSASVTGPISELAPFECDGVAWKCRRLPVYVETDYSR